MLEKFKEWQAKRRKVKELQRIKRNLAEHSKIEKEKFKAKQTAQKEATGKAGWELDENTIAVISELKALRNDMKRINKELDIMNSRVARLNSNVGCLVFFFIVIPILIVIFSFGSLGALFTSLVAP